MWHDRRLARTVLDARAAPAPSDAYRRGRRAHRRTALAHGVAGLAYAAVFTAVWMLWVTPDGFLPGRILWMLSSYWWPTFIILALLVTTSSLERLLLAGGYTLVLAAIGSYLLAYNATLRPLHLLTFWATANALETVLVLAFLARRIRAVGPLVLAFVTAGLVGATMLVQLAGQQRHRTAARGGVRIRRRSGRHRSGSLPSISWASHCSPSSAWWALRQLAARHQQKLLQRPDGSWPGP